MTKTELREMITDIVAKLDEQPADGDHLAADAMMDLIDQLVNIITLCQAEILDRASTDYFT